MNTVAREAVLALVIGFAATTLMLVSLARSNSQAAPPATDSTTNSERPESHAPPSSMAATASAQTGTVPCLNESEFITLTNLINCISGYVPTRQDQDHRPGFVTPTALAKTQWMSVVTQMMDGKCDDIDLSQYDWGSDFAVRTITDTSGMSYCVFMETTYGTFTHTENSTTTTITRVIRGWGTFIHNPNYTRDLNISAPHPISDKGTITEAIGIFEQTRSRTFLMAGTHRDAHDKESDCQPDACEDKCMKSDAAHNITHTFQATIEALKGYYDSHCTAFYHLQFHGMASCCGVYSIYLSLGASTTPTIGDKILELRENLQDHNKGWVIGVPGDGTCDLDATKNVQGRLLNGVPADQVCDTPAAGYSGYFVHVEQCDGYRDPDHWSAAVKDTWPPVSRCGQCHCMWLPIVLKVRR